MREEIYEVTDPSYTATNRKGKWVTSLYESLDELADRAMERVNKGDPNVSPYRTRAAANLAHNGWDGKGDTLDKLDLVRDAVRLSVGKIHSDTVTPHFDVAGGFADMGRYMAGDPECMMAFPLIQTSRVGKVVRLCASVDAYAGAWNTLYKRGLGIVALVEALSQLGHAVELYLDVFCNAVQGQPGNRWGGDIRCLVKGARDTLDMRKVLFAYAWDEGVMQSLGMPNTHWWPDESQSAQGIPYSYGQIGDPPMNLPEGTLYIPHAMHGFLLDPANLVRHYLVQLGLAPADTLAEEWQAWNEKEHGSGWGNVSSAPTDLPNIFDANACMTGRPAPLLPKLNG